MSSKKKLTWAEIVENDELLAKMWNSFALHDNEVATEFSNYGYFYSKVYPNTVESILNVYENNAKRFLQDNMSFWGNGGGDGYNFDNKWFIANESSSEERYITSDNSVIELIELIIMDRFGDMTKASVGVKRRFKQFCIEHQDEFKEKEA